MSRDPVPALLFYGGVAADVDLGSFVKVLPGVPEFIVTLNG